MNDVRWPTFDGDLGDLTEIYREDMFGSPVGVGVMLVFRSWETIALKGTWDDCAREPSVQPYHCDHPPLPDFPSLLLPPLLAHDTIRPDKNSQQLDKHAKLTAFPHQSTLFRQNFREVFRLTEECDSPACSGSAQPAAWDGQCNGSGRGGGGGIG